MAQCVKVFINSLYGKFGEKHHDMNIITSNDDIDDEDKYKRIIGDHVASIKGLDM